MKKFLSLISVIILVFSCLGLTAFAKTSSVAISDDFQKLYMDDVSYSRFNSSMINATFETINISVELSKTQQETVEEIVLQANENRNIILADIHFNDGSILSVSFLQDDYRKEYNEIIKGQNVEYIIDFEWPEENTVSTKMTCLWGERITLYEDSLEWCDYYNVIIQSKDGSMTIFKGSLLIVDDEYYYVDYEENDIKKPDNFSPYFYTKLTAHEITDTDLLLDIQDAEDAYYSDDLGFLYDDDFTEAISAVFLIFVFAVMPFAIFIVFLILAIRSKTFYKKLFSTICVISAAEIAVFISITSIILMLK